MANYSWDAQFKKHLTLLNIPKNWQTEFLVEEDTCTIALRRKQRYAYVYYTPTDGRTVTCLCIKKRCKAYAFTPQDLEKAFLMLEKFLHEATI
jgi:hypothetical protein